jgi:hypothetical protein
MVDLWRLIERGSRGEEDKRRKRLCRKLLLYWRIGRTEDDFWRKFSSLNKWHQVMKLPLTPIFLLLLFSCSNNRTNQEETSSNSTKSHESNRLRPSYEWLKPREIRYKSTVEKSHLENYGIYGIETTVSFKDHPFTNNPTILHLYSNKIPIDSLKQYFRYRNIERLDTICPKLFDWYQDSLNCIKFFNNEIITKKSDTIRLNHFQFLVGNIKAPNISSEILLFIDYIEDWGPSFFLVSIDENDSVIDIKYFCYFGGDGGDFVSTELKSIDIYSYQTIKKTGFQTYTEPIDTIKYTNANGLFKIQPDGVFEYLKTKPDSSIVETRRIK